VNTLRAGLFGVQISERAQDFFVS